MEREDNSAVVLGFNLLAGVPGALANVWGLGWRKSDLHFLRLAPDHIEGGLFEFLEIEVFRDFKAPVGRLCGLNSLDGKGPQGIFPVVVTDEVQSVIHVPNLVRIDFSFDGLRVMRCPVIDPHSELVEDGVGQRLDHFLEWLKSFNPKLDTEIPWSRPRRNLKLCAGSCEPIFCMADSKDSYIGVPCKGLKSPLLK